MKKVFQLLFVSFLVVTFASCSNDNDSNTPMLLTRLNASVMGDSEQYNFSYNGTKLTRISYQIAIGTVTSGYLKIIYTGDLITQIKDFNGDNINTDNTFLTYNADGRLIEVLKVEVGTNHAERTVFNYNSDNTVDSQNYVGTESSQTTLSYSEKFYFQNNQLVKKESNVVALTEYNYDTANHPMKNVTGIDAIMIYANSFDSFLSLGLRGVSNNIIKETWYSDPSTVMEVMDFESTYNDENFPVSIYTTPASPGPYNYLYEYNN